MKKWWDKYKNLVWFCLVTVIIVWFVWAYVGFENVQASKNLLWGFILSVDTATAIALAVLAFFAYYEYAKGEDEIPVVLNVDGTEFKDEKLKLLRKSISRSEILGVLGMIQNDSKQRFDFKYMVDFEFLEQINSVQKGQKKKVVVYLTKKEFIKYFSNFFKADISDVEKPVEIIFETENKKYKLSEKLNIYRLDSKKYLKEKLKKYLKNNSVCLKILYLNDECFNENVALIEEGKSDRLVLKLKKGEFDVFDSSKFEQLKEGHE
jgi:hypothetical protein